MPQSLSQVTVHVVFSTYQRTPWISEEMQPRLFAYLATVLKNSDNLPIIVGGHTDHVHLLFGQSKVQTLAKNVQNVKVASSIWMKDQNPELRSFAWQTGYGAFSLSARDRHFAKVYIENQAEHHRVVSFQDELRALLIENDVAFDERYLWE